MYIFYLIMISLLPIALYIIGVVFKDNSPKNINKFMGYRTKRSMASIEAWEFANKNAAKIFKKTSIPLLFISILVFIPTKQLSDDVQSFIVMGIIFIQLLSLVFTIYLIEKDLKRKFGI